MPLTILHGDQHVRSRQQLFELTTKFQEKGWQIKRAEAEKSFDPAKLESMLAAQELFLDQNLIVIEGLLGSIKSKRKDALIELILKYEPTQEIILWEPKKLTVTQLKKFTSFKTQEFSFSSTMFRWLDTLQGTPAARLKLFLEADQQEGAELCFMMLARQLRLLLIVKTGEQLKEHPFVIKKVQGQARAFSLEQLKALHEQLTQIDFRQKTGRARLTLKQELEQIMLKF